MIIKGIRAVGLLRLSAQLYESIISNVALAGVISFIRNSRVIRVIRVYRVIRLTRVCFQGVVLC